VRARALAQREPGHTVAPAPSSRTGAAPSWSVPPVGSAGHSLDHAVRAFAEPRFGRDFSQVRVHTDAAAAESARTLGARAYTVGRDIVFGRGEYAPHSAAGQRLLAHELGHVVQQHDVADSVAAPVLGRLPVSQPGDVHERSAEVAADAVVHGLPATALTALPAAAVQGQFGDVHLAELKREVLARVRIDYAKARKQNTGYAALKSLGWESKLATVAGGAYKDLADLWGKDEYDAFAGAVASRQFDVGLREPNIDGIIGPGTWARMAGLGEAMASIAAVRWKDSEELCYKASEERIKRGFGMAAGRGFALPEDRTASVFDAIIASIPGRMKEIDLAYRGTGAAGALVYAGLGTFVPETDIFTGGLRPGAAMQVWAHQEAYDLLRAGEIVEKGKARPITDADANFSGTSFVFIRYDTDTNERILVRHFGGEEWHEQSDYAVWVAANASLRP
jgi:hypothetical protein